VGWDAALERICTFGQFKHIKSGKVLWIFNTHFDHMGEIARKMSAELILKQINESIKEKLPVILMGDFNATNDSEPIQLLKSQLSDAKQVSQTPFYGPPGTFNNFDPMLFATECIDFVFVSKLNVLSCTHIDYKKDDGRCISDHYPVLIEVKF
jgi:endonuclease/exonuclease/phosphatase family metal-dependent hydrolase